LMGSIEMKDFRYKWVAHLFVFYKLIRYSNLGWLLLPLKTFSTTLIVKSIYLS